MSILDQPSDYADWDKLAEHCRTLSDLPDEERARASEAMLFLKAEFGESFLSRAWSGRHPVLGYITNLVPWTRTWITDLASAMREMKSSEGYAGLRKGLLDPSTFRERHSVLEAGHRLCTAGFRVRFDPRIPGSPKTPDLGIHDPTSNQESYVEIAELHESLPAKEAGAAFEQLTKRLWRCFPSCQYAGSLHRTPAPAHLEEVLRKVDRLIDTVGESGTFQELIIPGILELGMTPSAHEDSLRAWAAARGMTPGSLAGPVYELDEVTRIKNKAYGEQEQLPKDSPGILIISDPNFFWASKDLRRDLELLAEVLYRFEQVVVMVVVGSWLGRIDEQIEWLDDHCLIRGQRYGLLAEHRMILRNRFCRHKISDESIRRLYCGLGLPGI